MLALYFTNKKWAHKAHSCINCFKHSMTNRNRLPLMNAPYLIVRPSGLQLKQSIKTDLIFYTQLSLHAKTCIQVFTKKPLPWGLKYLKFGSGGWI